MQLNATQLIADISGRYPEQSSDAGGRRHARVDDHHAPPVRPEAVREVRLAHVEAPELRVIVEERVVILELRARLHLRR